MDALAEEMLALSRDVKAIRLEWEETFESVNRALRKLAKREQRAGKDCGCAEKETTIPENGHAVSDLEALRAARARYPGAF